MDMAAIADREVSLSILPKKARKKLPTERYGKFIPITEKFPSDSSKRFVVLWDYLWGPSVCTGSHAVDHIMNDILMVKRGKLDRVRFEYWLPLPKGKPPIEYIGVK